VPEYSGGNRQLTGDGRQGISSMRKGMFCRSLPFSINIPVTECRKGYEIRLSINIYNNDDVLINIKMLVVFSIPFCLLSCKWGRDYILFPIEEQDTCQDNSRLKVHHLTEVQGGKRQGSQAAVKLLL